MSNGKQQKLTIKLSTVLFEKPLTMPLLPFSSIGGTIGSKNGMFWIPQSHDVCFQRHYLCKLHAQLEILQKNLDFISKRKTLPILHSTSVCVGRRLLRERWMEMTKI